jgi:hypothetical protein
MEKHERTTTTTATTYKSINYHPVPIQQGSSAYRCGTYCPGTTITIPITIPITTTITITITTRVVGI